MRALTTSGTSSRWEASPVTMSLQSTAQLRFDRTAEFVAEAVPQGGPLNGAGNRHARAPPRSVVHDLNLLVRLDHAS